MSNEEDEEFEMVFEPDEALILALNEIHSLKQLIEDQNSSINELRKDLLDLKSKK
jgi:cell division protein FtsL